MFFDVSFEKQCKCPHRPKRGTVCQFQSLRCHFARILHKFVQAFVADKGQCAVFHFSVSDACQKYFVNVFFDAKGYSADMLTLFISCGFSDNCKQILSTSASSMKGSSVVKFMSSSPFKCFAQVRQGLCCSKRVSCFLFSYSASEINIFQIPRPSYGMFVHDSMHCSQPFVQMLLKIFLSYFHFGTSQKPSFLVG